MPDQVYLVPNSHHSLYARAHRGEIENVQD